MKKRITWSASLSSVFVLAAFAAAMATEAPAAKTAGAPGELAPVVDWVLANGEHDKIDAFLAKVIGLGNSDLAVQKVAYETASDKLLHFVGVCTRADHILFSRQKVDRSSGVVWLTARNGELQLTAMLTQGTSAQIVPNHRYARGFAGLKRFFLGRASAAAGVPATASGAEQEPRKK